MSLQHPENHARYDTGAAGAEAVRLFHAVCDLESATYAARAAREKLRRATRNRVTAEGRLNAEQETCRDAIVEVHEDRAHHYYRLDLLRFMLDDAKRDEADALEDYRDALARVEATGRAAGEADRPDVATGTRVRGRSAIALADSFGNKVAMDATLYPELERPVLPALEPEVEVQEFRVQSGEEVRTFVLDPLDPVEDYDPPAPRATLVPVERYAETGNAYAAFGNDPDDEDESVEEYVEGTPWTAEDQASYDAEAADRAAGLVVNVHRAEILAHLENAERDEAGR